MVRFQAPAPAILFWVVAAFAFVSTSSHASTTRTLPVAAGTAPLADRTLAGFFPDATWSHDDTAAQSVSKIRTTPGRLTLGDHDFPLQRIQTYGSRGNADVATLFSTDAGGGARSALFRIHIPSDTKIKGNPVCGTADVNWAVILIEGNEMRVGFFTGAGRPNLDPKVIKNSHAVCSTMSFSRK